MENIFEYFCCCHAGMKSAIEPRWSQTTVPYGDGLLFIKDNIKLDANGRKKMVRNFHWGTNSLFTWFIFFYMGYCEMGIYGNTLRTKH